MRKIICYTICLCMLLLTACSTTRLPFNIVNYLTITETGYNEYGSISVEFDYNKFYQDYKAELNKSKVSIEQLQKSIYIECPTKDTLSNGDIVTIPIKTQKDVVDIEKIIKEQIEMSLSYTVADLKELTPYNPFENLIVTTSGFHKTGTIYPHIEHYGVNASWEWPVLVDENKNGQLSNGDVVELTLDIDEDAMERKYGIDISSSTYSYQVTTLISHMETSADLRNLSDKNIEALNKVIEDWVISGENDENIYNRERTYEFETAFLFVKEGDSRVCFIYHIEDGYVPSGYYVYISPNYTVLADNENHTLISGDKRPLSSSFAKYDKDTVRYTEKWGWGQDYERQGFMYRDVPYAGKATLEDMIAYLQGWYSEYPTMYQLP